MMRLLLSLLLLLSFLQMNAQTYPKVILPGDYLTLLLCVTARMHDDSFSFLYYAPGFLIRHSQDLMNWEPLSPAMPQMKALPGT